MFRFTFLILGAFLFLSSCESRITSEELGESVFEAFQQNDVEMALEYILYSEDYHSVFAASDLTDEERKVLQEKYDDPDRIDELVTRFKKRFDEIIQQGIALGIVWKETKLEEVKPPKIRVDESVKSGEIYIVFSYKNNHYEIRLDDCIDTPSRGWLMSDEPSFKVN